MNPDSLIHPLIRKAYSVLDGQPISREDALAIGADTFQFFTRNPRGMARKEPDPEDVGELRSFLSENGFGPIIAHAPYIYNPASPEREKWELACRAMKEKLDALA